MAAGLTTKTVGDGDSGTMTAGFVSSDGTSGGTLRPATTLYTAAGTEIDMTAGTAGTPAGGVSSVQGVSGMTPLDANLKQVAGAAISQGHGTAAAAIRVELPTDGTGIVGLASVGFSAVVALTRTADTNVYLANDVIGAATGSTAALSFASMGASAGRIMITSVALEIDVSSIPSGMTSFRLYLYNVTPPSALGDNAAWDLPSGDRASYLGYVDLGSPVDLGSTLYVETNGINKQVKLAGTGLFGYLVTNGAYTPTSAAVFGITLHAVGL